MLGLGCIGGCLGLIATGCSGAAAVGDDESGPDASGEDPPPDASSGPDAGYTAQPLGCVDVEADIYVTPDGLPPLTADGRGDVVRCAQGMVLDVAAVASRLTADGAEGVVPTTGVSIVKVAYRTVRGDGSATVTTATVYLPLEPRALPAPVAIVARSTAGIADGCAPSLADVPLADLALPFAARGFVVVSPDFSGLGNEGVHAYLDNREAAAQLFDGARSLDQLVAPGVIGDPVVAAGYSQGGGAVLTLQALEAELTGRHALRGVVAIAPEWPIRINSFGYEDVLRNPDQITGTTGLAPPTVTVMRQYGWFVNHLGVEHGADSFPPAERVDLVDSIESLCTIELGAAVGAEQPRVRDMLDEPFRVAMLACIDGVAGCVEPAASFHAWLEANVVTADSGGADVHIVQGLGDQVMPAASEASCDVAKLRAEGVEPTVCSDTFATHDTVLERKIEHVVAWAEAAVDGGTRPTCSSSFLPSCQP